MYFSLRELVSKKPVKQMMARVASVVCVFGIDKTAKHENTLKLLQVLKGILVMTRRECDMKTTKITRFF